MKKRVLSSSGQRRVRVGRKAIACGRMISVIEKRLPKDTSKVKKPNKFSFPKFTLTKRSIVVASIVVVLLLGSSGGYVIYADRQEKARVVAEKIRLEQERVASQKAAICRQDVVAKKADLVGKATFGELYGTACSQ